MEIGQLVNKVIEAGPGIGSVAFLCRISSIKPPHVELTTDGFMICYGRFHGVHVFKQGETIYCAQIENGNTDTHALHNQLLANELYSSMLDELLAAA